MKEYELIIIGAGPAGLSAALNASYLKMNFLVFEANVPGGIPASTYPWKHVDNYLGFKNLTGREAAKKMIEHAESEGVKIKKERVTEIKKYRNKLKVVTNKNMYLTSSVILAAGSGEACRRLGIKGEDLPQVKYVLTEPKKYKDKKVLVVGGGDTALEYAATLKKAKSDVTIVHRKNDFRATRENKEKVVKSKIEVLWNTEVKEILGKKNVEKVRLFNNKTNAEQLLDADYAFMCLGVVPNTDFLKKTGLKLDKSNNVVVDSNLMTGVKGVFAAGDVTGKLRRIPEAIGEGALATFSAFKYIKNPYWA